MAASRATCGSSAAQARARPPPCEAPVAPTRPASTSGMAMTMRASCAQSRKIRPEDLRAGVRTIEQIRGRG